MSNENTPRSGLKEEIHLLAHGALSGDLRGAQARRLERLIVENPEARRLYYECICDVYNLRKCVDRSAGTRDHVLHTEEQDRFEATLAELSAALRQAHAGPGGQAAGTNVRIPIVGLRRDRKSRESRVQGLLHRMIQAGGGTPAAAAMTWTVMAIFAGGAVLTLTFIAMIVFGVKPPAGQPEVAGRIERSAERGTPSFVSSTMHRAPSLTPVARLVRVADCIWEENAVAPKAGDDLLPGRKLQLKAGLAQIFFQGGAATVLEGPAKLEIRSTMGAYLQRGKFSVTVENPLARGFEVRTPGMKFTDLGTEFAVLVAKNGEQEMHVFRGKVRAEVMKDEGLGMRDDAQTADSSDNGPNPSSFISHPSSVVLSADQGIRVPAPDALGKQDKPVQRIAVNEKKFVRAMPHPEPFALFGTGATSTDRAADPHWEITEISTDSSFKPQPAVVSVPNIGYARDNRNIAQWISSRKAIGDLDMPVGCRWTLRTHFDLTGFDPSTARVAGRIVVDNFLAEVRLNGEALPLPEGSRDRRLYVKWLALKIENGFAAGDNILEIVIENAPFETATSAPNPMAMCLELKGTAMRRPAASTD